MKHVTLVCIAFLAAATTAMLSQTAGDIVDVSCGSAACPAGNENGILLVAKTVKKVIQPTQQTSIPVGTVNPAYSQVVAFRSDRSPGIQTGVSWTSRPETVRLTYPDLADVPLQIWVICLDKACGPVTQMMRDTLEQFRSHANDLLTAERAGMRITQAGGAGGWISDETQNSALLEFRDFVSDQCGDLDRAVTRIGKKKTDAVNMYLVRTVDSETSTGYRCIQNLAVDGWTTSWTTKLHEVGHTMSLLDVSIGNDPDKNLMFSMPSDPLTRQYLTEGQVFRIHFNVDSSLNKVFNLRDPSLQRDCGRTNASGQQVVPPCPPVATVIWPEN